MDEVPQCSSFDTHGKIGHNLNKNLKTSPKSDRLEGVWSFDSGYSLLGEEQSHWTLQQKQGPRPFSPWPKAPK